MTGLLLALKLAVPGGAPTPAPPISGGPTFCVEWIRQSSEGYDRLTLFRDGTLVWKANREGHEDLKRQDLDADELRFYCEFFGRPEFWSLPDDLRTGLASDLASESEVTLARSDGKRKKVRFDEFSADTVESASLRSSLEGLKGLFLSPLAPASRFAPSHLTPGVLLRRFDGVVFRVRRLQKETGFVEVEGVNVPYSQFLKVEELRFQFWPPEPPS